MEEEVESSVTTIDEAGELFSELASHVDYAEASGEAEYLAGLSAPAPLTLMTDISHGAGTAIPGARSLREALESEVPMWVPVDASDAMRGHRFVIADRHRAYGLWERCEQRFPETRGVAETRTYHERVSPWFAWQQGVSEILVAGLDGSTERVGEAATTVVVYTPRGVRRMLPDLSDEDGDSIRRVVAKAKAGVALPEARVAIDKVNNALRTIAFDERAASVKYACTGWILDDDGVLVFGAPGGSVDASGPRPDVCVVAPVGSAPGALKTSSLGSLRVDRLAKDDEARRHAAESISLTLGITPRRLDVGVAVIGAIFSAPLMLATRGVVFIQGGAGTGKSLEATVTTGFQTDEHPDKNRLPISIPKSSKVGAKVIAGWARGLTVAGDDWRIEGLSQVDERAARGTLTTLVQAGYGAAEEAKGTQQGGLRAGQVSQATVLVTGEVGPPDAAQTSRSIHLRVEKGDFDLAGPGNAYDRWVECADAGAPNMLFSSYIHWLAQRADAIGGLTALMREAESVRRAWASTRTEERASETVASLAVGWHYLRAFLDDWLLESVLPDEAALAAVFDTLVRANVDVAETTSLGARLVEALAAMIQGGSGHLTSHSNGMPTPAGRWGWSVRTSNGDESGHMVGMGPKLGWVSGTSHTPECDRRVTIGVDGLKVAWSDVTGGQQWSRETAERAVAPYTEHGAKGSPKSKPRLADTPDRREGYVMRLDVLGLSSEEADGVAIASREPLTCAVATHSDGAHHDFATHIALVHGGSLDVSGCQECCDHVSARHREAKALR